MPVDIELFKGVAGSFPAGVAVVTSRGADGVPRGLTSNAICPVSASPPLLLVCVDKCSQTLPSIRQARAFVVNLLAAGREELSDRFASKDPDKLAGVAWAPSPVAAGAPILIDDVVAVAECLVTREIDAGDHWIFIASIEAGTVYEGVPLMYYRRAYAAWPKPALALATGGPASPAAADWASHQPPVSICEPGASTAPMAQALLGGRGGSELPPHGTGNRGEITPPNGSPTHSQRC